MLVELGARQGLRDGGPRRATFPAAVGGHKVHLAHVGFTFAPDADAMDRWRGWWRVVSVDQWGVFFVGAILGMALPALLYVTFLPRRDRHPGLGISAALASAVGAQAGRDSRHRHRVPRRVDSVQDAARLLEGMVRAITDILWTGSSRVRAWRGGDVRAVYYTVLAVLVVWGIFALRLAQPIVLLKIGANVAGAVFVIAVAAPALRQHAHPPATRAPADVAPRRPGRDGRLLRVLRDAIDCERVVIARL